MVAILNFCQKCKTTILLRQYILSNGQLLYRSARPVPPNDRKRRPVDTTGRTGHRVCIHSVAPRTSFLSRQRDVIASFSFGVWSVQTCFQQRNVFEVLQQTLPFYFISSSIIISPDESRGYIGFRSVAPPPPPPPP